MTFRAHCRSVAFLALALLVACNDDKEGASDLGGGDINNGDIDNGDGTGDVTGGDVEVSDTVILPDVVEIEAETGSDVSTEVAQPGEFGSPCNGGADCDSGYCVEGPKGGICTRTCDTTCPEGYDCKAVGTGDDAVFLCIPRFQEPCAPCTQNFQCQGGLCMDIDGEGRCVFACEAQADCDEGFACAETSQASGLFCQPTTKSCTCYAGADAGVRSCSTPSPLGVCVGIQECDPGFGWSLCSADKPSVEVCDGEDNDCNGIWDDALADAGMPCQNTVEGIGSCTGTNICLGEAGWLCQGPTPGAEVCDGQDNDCSGVADDPFKTPAGIYGLLQHCGGCNVSCVGRFTNATAYCNADGPSPRCEVETCDVGYYKAGPQTCLPVDDFSCVPCLQDSHCVATNAQCLPLDGGQFCGRDCAAGNVYGTPAGQCPSGFSCRDFPSEGAGVRQCVPTSNSCSCLPGDGGTERPCSTSSDGGTCFGTQTCDPGTGGWSACSAGDPKTETCNGADDNCNAVVDDVPGRFDACSITNSFGTCPGQLDCRTGAALSCVGTTPATETCNGRDDDCNGQTDNVQGQPCALTRGVCAGSRQLCGGSLGFIACSAANYGPNYEGVETKCDGLDNDCDGITDDVDQDGDTHRPVACGGDDCNDLDASSYPGATELCGDRVDNNCDGTADNRDADRDGFIAAQCGGNDCNDDAAAAKPGGTEVCGDRLDNDCDGVVDNKDFDRDGFVDVACLGTDCNDARPDIGPGKDEICDGVDNNCNTIIDDKDYDRDSYIDADCGGNDCDDTRPLANIDGVEVCGINNLVDEDCSGVLNDRDVDGDGFIAKDCKQFPGEPDGNDCDDFDAQTGPGLAEVWDTKDNNCDNIFDEGALDLVSFPNVIITETMGDPVTVADTQGGEYFELTNLSPYPINLRGWRVESNNDPGFTINQELIIQSGQAMVFCQNTIRLTQSGVPCSFEYNVGVIISDGASEFLRLRQMPGGPFIDEVTLNVGGSNGRARVLKAAYYTRDLNDDYENNWCPLPANAKYDINGTAANGDYGTPGTINPRDCATNPAASPAFAVPNFGIGFGGDVITIYGRGFVQGGTTVDIGGTPCTNVTVDTTTNTKLTCTTGVHAPGGVSIAITVSSVSVTTQTVAFIYTDAGNGNFTSAALVGAAPYTLAAGLPGPIIAAAITPSGLTGVRAQVGYGPADSDPSMIGGWQWFPAIKLATPASPETWGRSLVIPTAGPYSYGFRFSQDGITWRYTDRSTTTITP